MSIYGERIVRLEEKLVGVEERMNEIDAKMDRIEHKLDDLLTLKHKGAGAFWLVSLIFGAAVMGYSIVSFLRFFR